MSWGIEEIGNLCEVGRGSSPRPINNRAYFDGGEIPWIKIADATSSGKEIIETKEHVNSFGASFSRLLPIGSLILATSGVSLGQVKFLGVEGCIHDGWLYIKNYKGIDKEFLYYKLIELEKHFHSESYGAAIQNINTDILRRTKISLPPLTTQKRIASILSAYDNLIENNLKRIKLLEKTAQNIYKEWFVNFRFPNYENTEFDGKSGLPMGWNIYKLNHFIDHHIGGGWGNEIADGEFTDSAYVIRGTDMPDIKLGMFSNIPLRFHKTSNLKSRKIQPNDIVFEVSGGSAKYPVGRSIILNLKTIENFGNENIMCASFCKLIRPKNEIISPIFLSMFLDNKYMDGTIAQYENRSASNIVNFKFETFLEKQLIYLPPKEILVEFEKTILPINDLRTVLGTQISKLKEARDILLPRLMNRTIEV